MVTQKCPVSPWSVTRAKNNILQAGIPLRVPAREDLREDLRERLAEYQAYCAARGVACTQRLTRGG